MRTSAEFWIKAYVRRVAASGAFATIVRHGDDDAGSVFIVVRALDGTAALYVPAPTAFASDGQDSERLWTQGLPPGTPEADVEARIRRETGFDPDLWVVEVEDRKARHFLDDWLMK